MIGERVFHIYRQRIAETDYEFALRVEDGLRAAARPFDVQITDVYNPASKLPQSTVYIIEDPR